MLSIKMYVGVARCVIIMYPISMEKEAQAFLAVIEIASTIHDPFIANMWASLHQPHREKKDLEREGCNILYFRVIFILE
jgi:hypothetical protein